MAGVQNFLSLQLMSLGSSSVAARNEKFDNEIDTIT
jgi:hypothetical protein